MSRSSGGDGIIIPILISLLATAGIAAGGLGIGLGVSRVIYGPLGVPAQDSAQNSSKSSETQIENNQIHTTGSSLGPNIHEENGVIIWQSEYFKSHGGVPNVVDETKTGSLEAPMPDQAPAVADDPVQEDTISPDQNQAQTVRPAQTQAPDQSSTSSPGSGTDTPGKPNQPTVNISPSGPSSTQTEKPSEGNTSTSNAGSYEDNFAAGKVLITTASDNNKDPVYHTKYCRSAQKILPADMRWYDSAKDAEDAGRRLCGNCKR